MRGTVYKGEVTTAQHATESSKDGQAVETRPCSCDRVEWPRSRFGGQTWHEGGRGWEEEGALWECWLLTIPQHKHAGGVGQSQPLVLVADWLAGLKCRIQVSGLRAEPEVRAVRYSVCRGKVSMEAKKNPGESLQNRNQGGRK